MANYLYNGIELPALPIDKTAYPYVVISSYLGGAIPTIPYSVRAFAAKPTVWEGDDGTFIVGNADETAGYCSSKYLTASGWNDVSTATGNGGVNSGIIKWSNFDIYNTDGTLYLAASEPVPILAPAIDPLSMWLGYQAGQWVVRQRGARKA